MIQYILNTNSGLFPDCPAGGAVVNSLVTSQGDICSWLPRRLCLVWPQSIFNQHDSAEMSGGGRGLMKMGNNKSERKIICFTLYYSAWIKYLSFTIFLTILTEQRFETTLNYLDKVIGLKLKKPVAHKLAHVVNYMLHLWDKTFE